MRLLDQDFTGTLEFERTGISTNAQGPHLMTFKIPRLALSALETDVLEVAADPEGYGLDAEETAAYVALAGAVRGQALHVPSNPTDRDRVQCLLLELGNNLNEQAEAGHDPKFSRAASRGLCTLASKLLHAA